jgi:acetyltransferase-like isoleucine patch superfamily enzyme
MMQDLSGVFSISGRPVSPDWVIIGKHSYYARNLGVASWLPGERIVIGDYCSIADQVVIMTGGNRRTDQAANYPVDILSFSARSPEAGSRAPVGVSPVMAKRLAAVRAIIPMLVPGRSYRSTRDTTIGNDVWVGYGAMIVGGAHVGDGAVIAAGSVVFSDVPPYAIVAGNPAKIIRSRFSPRTVERMLRIRWWHWPEEQIRANLAWFHRPISEFVERFDRHKHE